MDRREQSCSSVYVLILTYRNYIEINQQINVCVYIYIYVYPFANGSFAIEVLSTVVSSFYGTYEPVQNCCNTATRMVRGWAIWLGGCG